MALSQAQIVFLSEQFSGDSILAQLAVGNVSQGDADRILALNISSIPTEFEQMPDLIEDFVSAKETIILDELDGVIQAQFDFLGGLEDKIKGVLLAVLDPILDLIQAIPNQINAGINNTIGGISALVNDLESRILNPILGTLSETIALVSRLDDVIIDSLNATITPIRAVSDSIFDQVQGFATALRDTIPELGSILGDALTGVGDAVGDAVRAAFEQFIDSTGLGGLKAVLDAVGRIPELIDPQGAFSPDLTEKMGAGTREEFLKNPAAMVTLVLPFISTLAGIVFAGQVERVQQASKGDHNSGLMAVTDMTALQQRGFAVAEEVQDVGFRTGLNTNQIRQVFELTKTRLGTLDIVDYWRREILTDDQAFAQLRSLGWDELHIGLIQQAAFPPPGVQDLIRMAVREVFSPEIAEAFGQFDEIPEPYLLWAKRIGLSEEWARNYWAAHWVLPSVQQGFEMLHRGVINEEEIERLFVALDIMPFWRPQIKAISFRPFTRVDVRRMFALGILDESQVNRAYLDLGFDQTKADAQTLFTVRWVESTRKVEKDRERDLTKGDIIGMFNDGLLSPQDARESLQGMGFDQTEADLLIRREELQEMLRDRKADIKLIVDRAKIKVLSFQEAQDRLNGLDLTQIEMAKALLDVTRATSERVRLPSKADLDNWIDLDLLSLDQYEAELDNLGFPSKYVALYVEEIQLETADDLLAAEEREAKRVEPRPITKGNLDSLLRGGIIGADEYTNGLDKLGFSNTAIADFTTQITLQIEERRIEDEARASRGEALADKEKPLSRVTLGKLLLKGIITIDAYQEGLRVLGFAPESIELLVRLIQVKIESLAEES